VEKSIQCYTSTYKDEVALDAELNKHLEYWEKEYGNEFKDQAPEERFQHVSYL
jgi:hypothetical protein